jgi:hypothetical protein
VVEIERGGGAGNEHIYHNEVKGVEWRVGRWGSGEGAVGMGGGQHIVSGHPLLLRSGAGTGRGSVDCLFADDDVTKP